MTGQTGTSQRSAPPVERGGWVHVCERCGERMEERHCKIRCGNCGFTRDCSDP